MGWGSGLVWRGRGRKRGREIKGKSILVQRKREKKKKQIKKSFPSELKIHGCCNNTLISHNFNLTNVDDFWGGMCKIDPLCYFALSDRSVLRKGKLLFHTPSCILLYTMSTFFKVRHLKFSKMYTLYTWCRRVWILLDVKR